MCALREEILTLEPPTPEAIIERAAYRVDRKTTLEDQIDREVPAFLAEILQGRGAQPSGHG